MCIRDRPQYLGQVAKDLKAKQIVTCLLYTSEKTGLFDRMAGMFMGENLAAEQIEL